MSIQKVFHSIVELVEIFCQNKYCALVQDGKLDYTMNNFHSSFPRLKYGKMKIKMQLETVVRHKNTQKRMQSTFCASNFQSCKMALISSSSACFSFISDKIRLYSCLEKNENLNLPKIHYFDIQQVSHCNCYQRFLKSSNCYHDNKHKG